ncbi:MAG: hypothetical protein QG570_593 [Patescibacteria group bacterium]|nr:hypothetical protein [Patescibacteria group bacterium]
MENNYIIIGAVGLLLVGIAGFYVMNGASDTMENETPKKVVETKPVEKKVMEEPTEEKMETNTIVDIAVGNPDFSTLVTAVTEAELAETLSGTGPFTVFAPVNAAFAKLPNGTVESLLKDKDQLTSVLTYHVVAGKVMAADAMKLTEAMTVQGQKIKISTNSSGEVMINDAKVISADIEASNGVIHVIDTVLLPK